MTRVISTLDPELTRLIRRAGPRKVVLLEGTEDLGIFKIWFGEKRDQLEFVVAGERLKVEAQVRLAHEAGYGTVVFGITDRDYTPEAQWSEEPEPHCYCLCRHELENYLLEPAALQHELATLLSPKEPPSQDALENGIQRCAQEGLSRTAANWLLSAASDKTLLRDAGKESKAVVVRHLADELGCSEEEAAEQLAEKELLLRPLLETLEGLHTCVEGKRLLHALKQAHFPRLQDSELKNLLARAVLATGLPPEMRRLVDEKVLRSASSARDAGNAG